MALDRIAEFLGPIKTPEERARDEDLAEVLKIGMVLTGAVFMISLCTAAHGGHELAFKAAITTVSGLTLVGLATSLLGVHILLAQHKKQERVRGQLEQLGKNAKAIASSLPPPNKWRAPRRYLGKPGAWNVILGALKALRMDAVTKT